MKRSVSSTRRKRTAFQTTEKRTAEAVRLACSLFDPGISADPPSLYLITELSKNPLSASFLGSHPVEAYLDASSALLVSDREEALKKPSGKSARTASDFSFYF